MVLRLLLDVVRRKRIAAVFAVGQVFLYCRIFWQIWPSSDPLAWSMMSALFLSIGSAEMLRGREIYLLPVTRRALWISRWCLSTIGGAAISQVAVSLAVWSGPSGIPDAEQMALSLLFGFLYAGCAMALLATTAGQAADTPVSWGPVADTPVSVGRTVGRPLGVGLMARAFATAFVRVVGTMVAFLAAPFLFARYLPHTFAQIDAWGALVLLAMSAITAWGFFHQPAVEARASQRAARGEAAPVVARATFADRLVGVTLVLWNESLKHLLTYSSALALLVAGWWVTSQFRTVPGLSELLSKMGELPFASPSARVTELITLGALLFVTSSFDVSMISNIRPLRALPLSSTQLGCIPIGLGLLSAVMLWIALLVLHVLVLGTVPVTLRPDLFIAVAALMAAARALRFLGPGQMIANGLTGMAPISVTWLVIGFLESWPTDIVQPIMFIGGLLTLCATFVVMRHAVRRSSRLYRSRSFAAMFGR
jgi:hypothetical protein